MTAVRVAQSRLTVLEARLGAADRALGSRPQDAAVADVTVLLTRVASELAELAAMADTATAAKLTALRSDVSGHLLAAATLESAGAPARACLGMLRRATDAARAGLDETYGGHHLLSAGA